MKLTPATIFHFPADSTLAQFAPPAAQAIAASLVDAAIADGYTLSLNDGEEWTIVQSRDRDAVLAAMATTDVDFLRLRRDRDDGAGTELVTTITLIWENGADLISDYTLPFGGEEAERFMEAHQFAGYGDD